ncbi:MAG: Lin0512 family protein [Chloroflexi bacterium]|nr:Lin0512 family protein [Chloroflexota bacterium]
MALVRCVTEMGMGVDVHGLDFTKAATRAVFDAIHHSSLGFQRMLGKTADDMTVQVTIGVSQPDKVDTAAVLASLPHGNGQGTCVAVQGGLEIPSVDGNDGMLIANAVIIVNFDDDK